MPNPSEYDTQEAWMHACVPTRIDEGDAQDQAVAVCLSIWRRHTGEPEPKAANPLKAISATDDELRVANYIVVFGGRDLEGIEPLTTRVVRPNPDGSQGEYFTKTTDLESSYTAMGRLPIDYEHGLGKRVDAPDAPGRDDILGYVDWTTKRVDDRGVWVERALNRHNVYVKWLEMLIDAGILGTSTEPVQGGVQKAENGEILRWPLYRDSLTITPMEPRMLRDNHIQALKALGYPVPERNADEPEPAEAEPEAMQMAVSVAKAKARCKQILLSLRRQQ